jgi:hypothetical protein
VPLFRTPGKNFLVVCPGSGACSVKNFSRSLNEENCIDAKNGDDENASVRTWQRAYFGMPSSKTELPAEPAED